MDLVYTNQGLIYKICRLYAAEPNREDLHQEIILQLWKSWPSFRGESRIQTWMYRIALNTALMDHRRQKLKTRGMSESEKETLAQQDDGQREEDQILQLYRHIASLGDLDKTIVFLYLEGCSYDEIAYVTGISTKNVGVRLVRIRKKLRELFKVKKEG